MTSANLVEMFSSFQGEGPHVGCSTLFVRFGGCDLRCRWCDSPNTWKPSPACRVAGPGAPRELRNPVSMEATLEAAEGLGPERHRFVSLTGGEPLLQAEAVLALARALGGRGPRILLETHGLLEPELARVLDAIDIVSMDWKLATEVRRAGNPRRAQRESFDAEHARFLRTALRAAEVYVKVVVAPSTRDAELDALAAQLADVDPGVCLVLQPVTPFGPVRSAPAPEQLLAWQARLEGWLGDVRVIPQTHRAVGVA